MEYYFNSIPVGKIVMLTIVGQTYLPMPRKCILFRVIWDLSTTPNLSEQT